MPFFSQYSRYFSALAVFLEKNESIKWEYDIDSLLQELNTVCHILMADSFFKFYHSWKKPITRLLGNAIALEFITIMLLDWREKGCPSTVSAETKALQRDGRILFDRLVFEFDYQNVRVEHSF